jgi:hypothetical protein
VGKRSNNTPQLPSRRENAGTDFNRLYEAQRTQIHVNRKKFLTILTKRSKRLFFFVSVFKNLDDDGIF